MIWQILTKILPRAVAVTLNNYKILSRDYGHYQSAKLWQSIDKNGNPIPWYSYPMVEYLKQLDFSQKTIFEYGSGNSTLFWASRSKRVVAVEDDPAWYALIKPKLPANVEYILVDNKADYIKAIHRFSEKFDVVIVDGSHRFDCAKSARERMTDAGMMILDNADWFANTTAFLRESDLLEIDMAGFNPINGYVSTTSLFLSREVLLKPIGTQQPVNMVGGIVQQLD
jgi:hypothetical protein